MIKFTQKLFSSVPPSFMDFRSKETKRIQKENKQNLEKDLDLKRAEGIYKKFSWISEIYSTLTDYVNYCKTRINEQDVNTIALLVKDERRQAFSSEGLQFDYIRTYFSKVLDNGEDNKIVNLPNGGPNSLYLKNGIVIPGNKSGTISKSLDIKIEYNFLGKTLSFYGTMKVTDGAGGSQTNQYNDVINSNKEFVKVDDPNIYTFSVLDGTFYSEIKIKGLNRIYESNKNKALHCEDLGNFLIDSIIDWIKITFNDTEDESVKSKMTHEQLRLRKLKK